MSQKEEYERSLGREHYENQAIQEEDIQLPWFLYALLFLALAMMIYGGVEFFIHL